jgi:hypothetical protein
MPDLHTSPADVDDFAGLGPGNMCRADAADPRAHGEGVDPEDAALCE